MHMVAQSNTQEVYMDLLRDELFHPSIEDNKDVTDILNDLSLVSTEAYLDDLIYIMRMLSKIQFHLRFVLGFV